MTKKTQIKLRYVLVEKMFASGILSNKIENAKNENENGMDFEIKFNSNFFHMSTKYIQT